MLRGETIKSEDLLIWPIIAISTGVLSFQQLLEDGRKIIAALFMRGDIIDMRGLANRHHGHLIALGKTEICRLSPRTFEAAIDDNIDARKVAWSSLRRQGNRAMDHGADLAKKQALEKLASFVFECRHRLPDSVSDSKVHIPVRRLDLADYLGMQPETVSRGFKELQARGIIGIEGISNIEILDFPRLRRIANGDKHTENLRQTHENHFQAATGS
ncbi:MAG: Crp/Fnr family transcriptional regulator [Alphaproteobacteria bacterium]|nr:Crp/Fnr family transcriptional regulator [Alphaproteobacteria bacterium]